MADDTQVAAPEQVPAGNETTTGFQVDAPDSTAPQQGPKPGNVVQTKEAPSAGTTRQDSPGLDREPARGEAARKPTPDPTVAKPPSRRLKVGDRYIINYPRKAHVGWATIKTLTNQPGHLVGVEFDKELEGDKAQFATSCDGKCDTKKGLWVHPQHLATEEEHGALQAMGEAPEIMKHVEEMEFDSETGECRPVGAEMIDVSKRNQGEGEPKVDQEKLDAANVTEAPNPAPDATEAGLPEKPGILPGGEGVDPATGEQV